MKPDTTSLRSALTAGFMAIAHSETGEQDLQERSHSVCGDWACQFDQRITVIRTNMGQGRAGQGGSPATRHHPFSGLFVSGGQQRQQPLHQRHRLPRFGFRDDQGRSDADDFLGEGAEQVDAVFGPGG